MEFNVENAKKLLEAVKNEEVAIRPSLHTESDSDGMTFGELEKSKKARSEFDELKEIGEPLACSVFGFEIGADSGRSTDSGTFARKAEMWEAYASKIRENAKEGFGSGENSYDAALLGCVEGKAEAYRFLEGKAKKFESEEKTEKAGGGGELTADNPNDKLS